MRLGTYLTLVVVGCAPFDAADRDGAVAPSGDASVVDGSAEADGSGPLGRFCARGAPSELCADFDGPMVGWEYVDGGGAMVGEIAETTAGAREGRSLRVSVVETTSGELRLTKELRSASAEDLRVDLDVFVKAPTADYAWEISIVEVFVGVESKNDVHFRLKRDSTGAMRTNLGLSVGGEWSAEEGNAAFPFDQWVRVSLEVRTAGSGAGSVVLSTDSGIRIEASLGRAAVSPSLTRVLLGPYRSNQAGKTPALTTLYDNVVGKRLSP